MEEALRLAAVLRGGLCRRGRNGFMTRRAVPFLRA